MENADFKFDNVKTKNEKPELPRTETKFGAGLVNRIIGNTNMKKSASNELRGGSEIVESLASEKGPKNDAEDFTAAEKDFGASPKDLHHLNNLREYMFQCVCLGLKI